MVVDLGCGWGAAESSLGRLSGFYFIVSHVSTQTGLELTTRSWRTAYCTGRASLAAPGLMCLAPLRKFPAFDFLHL